MSRFAKAIVSAQWLGKELAVGNPKVHVFDCATVLDMSNPDVKPYRVVSGRAGYEKQHIKGADFFDLQQFSKPLDSVPKDTYGNPLQFMMAEPEVFLANLGKRMGVEADSHVVLYSHTDPKWATRVWWMLYASGFSGDYSVLNGGLGKWVAEGGDTASGPSDVEVTPAVLAPKADLVPEHNAFVGKAEVAGSVQDPEKHPLIHTLPKSVFDGATAKYGRCGHIRNARLLPATDFVNAADHDTFLDKPQVAEAFAKAGVVKPESLTAYCGGGITASLPAFLAVAQLGWDIPVSVYDGSLSEWCADENAPMDVESK